MPKLILLNPDGRQAELDLETEAVWIGRSRENAIPIADRRASRRHCRVESGSDGYLVVDDGSANGTLLNGKLAQRAALNPGDVIEIGETRIFFDRIDESEETGEIDPGSTRDQLARERINLLRLQRTARALTSVLEQADLFAMIVDHAIEIVEAERGFLLLRGEDGELTFGASRNFAGDTVSGSDLEISRSVASKVLETGESICAVNAQKDSNVRDIQSISILGLRSVLCIPLREREAVVGALYLDNRLARRAFGAEDLRMLEALADHVVVAIRNARLFAELDHNAKELETSRARVERLNEKLEGVVRGQSVELEQLRDAFRVRDDLGTKYPYREIIGRSPAMLRLLRVLDRVVDSEVPVFIYGESGTGKELVAKAIHRHGARNKGPIVSENCAALTETLLESELFGYMKGAFTGADRTRKGLFEVAHHGTLFLDEVGDMSTTMQRKLLRVLQEGEVRPVGGIEPVQVDVRIVSASNRDLRELVRTKDFREDLFYRLSVLQLRMPPLRERKEDVPLLISHFFDREAKRVGGKPRRMAPGVMDVLMSYDWPGNVRELENECLRMLALAGEVVEIDVLSEQIRGYVPIGVPLSPQDEVRDLTQLVQLVEVAEIEKALRLHDANKTKAADALHISRFALQRKMDKYGIDLPE